MRDTLDELISLETRLRRRDHGAQTRTRELLAIWQQLWDSDQLDPDMEVEADQVHTKMQQLLMASEASILVGQMLKGPLEYAEEAHANTLRAALGLKLNRESSRRSKAALKKARGLQLPAAAVAVAPQPAPHYDEIVENSN